ncbi:unnamed protein product [Tuber aestivum]|uniref:Uncharacterized protein n=1 Tax=Tuber aestivum TaxID=59557 RepID=A0A292PNY0_9PEZI|nr:unnamed protein product [Tuber aestivum]
MPLCSWTTGPSKSCLANAASWHCRKGTSPAPTRPAIALPTPRAGSSVPGGGLEYHRAKRYIAINVARAFLVTADVEVLEQTAWSALGSDKSKAIISSLRHLHNSPIWPLSRQPLAALRLALVRSEYIPPRNLERALLHHLLVY